MELFVDTLPPATMKASVDHWHAIENSVESDLPSAEPALENLDASLDDNTYELVLNGMKKSYTFGEWTLLAMRFGFGGQVEHRAAAAPEGAAFGPKPV